MKKAHNLEMENFVREHNKKLRYQLILIIIDLMISFSRNLILKMSF